MAKFSPIIEEGELEAPANWRARLRSEQRLPPVDSGQRLVIATADGTYVLADARTAGERMFKPGQRWARVDMTEHRLSFTFAMTDVRVLAELAITVTVTVAVRDAVAAVEHRGDDVEAALHQAIDALLIAIDGGEELPESAGLTRARQLSWALNQRKQAFAQLSGRPLETVRWLKGAVFAATVEFDEETRRHHADLIEKEREVHAAESGGAVERTRVAEELSVQDMRRRSMGKHITDARSAITESVLLNPTAENLQRAAEQLRALEREDREDVLRLLRLGVEQGFDHDEELQTQIRGIQGVGGGGARQLSQPSEGEGGTDATPEDEDPEPGEDRPDRDWGAPPT
jgi:uncharacterized membrane protein YfbV (UPF0208 family)